MPRITCLKCGSQYDVGYDTSTVPVNCECGPTISYPEVHHAGVQPSERAAERLRYRAFQSAGLVQNLGVIALSVSAVSVLFFPLAVVGVGIALYTLVAKRGPLGKYAGRDQAIAAIALGVLVFGIEGTIALNWMETRRVNQVNSVQASVRDDLRRLFRTQRLYRAAQDRYGSFDDFPGRFEPGAYTLYLAKDDILPAKLGTQELTDPHPGSPSPHVAPDAFTAVAVANLDSDNDLDIWVLNDAGDIVHYRNDNDYLTGFVPPPSTAPENERDEPAAAPPDSIPGDPVSEEAANELDAADASDGDAAALADDPTAVSSDEPKGDVTESPEEQASESQTQVDQKAGGDGGAPAPEAEASVSANATENADEVESARPEPPLDSVVERGPQAEGAKQRAKNDRTR